MAQGLVGQRKSIVQQNYHRSPVKYEYQGMLGNQVLLLDLYKSQRRKGNPSDLS